MLTACNENIPTIPFKGDVESITIHKQKTGDTVNEINDPSKISVFLKQMNTSKPGGFGDPEPPGETYLIILKNGSNNIMFYFKKGMTSTLDDKIYYDNSKHPWVPDKSFLKYFP
jgi:hypothetical protein